MWIFSNLFILIRNFKYCWMFTDVLLQRTVISDFKWCSYKIMCRVVFDEKCMEFFGFWCVKLILKAATNLHLYLLPLLPCYSTVRVNRPHRPQRTASPAGGDSQSPRCLTSHVFIPPQLVFKSKPAYSLVAVRAHIILSNYCLIDIRVVGKCEVWRA